MTGCLDLGFSSNRYGSRVPYIGWLILCAACVICLFIGPEIAISASNKIPPPAAKKPTETPTNRDTAQLIEGALGAEAYTFAFKDAEIPQVVEEILGVALGISYTVDPSVTGRMSFRIDQRLTKAQLYEALEVALAANDVALVRENDGVKITSRTKARTSVAVRSVDGQETTRVGYDVVAVPLSFSAPSEVGKALEAMTAADTVLYSNDKQGLIVLGGNSSQLDAALQTIKVLDKSALADARIRWFQLEQASAATVSSELGQLLLASGIATVSVVPLKRLNGIIVFGRTAEALDEVARWVKRLDVPARDNAPALFVYRPRSGSAEALGAVLNDAIGNRSGQPMPGAPIGAAALPSDNRSEAVSEFDNGIVRVAVEKEANSLLIFATPARWIQIQRILTVIDRPESQVLIEASILEVTLNNDFQFGVDWKLLGQGGQLTANSIYNNSGVVGPSFPGFSITYLTSNIKSAIKALGSKTDVELVSAPKIVTMDNRAAKLQIGDQVPIVTQSSQSAVGPNPALINTVEYRNTGVILNVTPRITGDNRIVLTVAQEVSSVAKTITSGIDSPTIQQRKLESTLAIGDGAVVALGGLISRRRSISKSGLPVARDIPAIGGLFRSTGRDDSRTELIVLLTARILADPEASGRVMADLLSDMKEIQKRGLLANAR